MAIGAFPTFLLLQIMLLRAFLYKNFCEHISNSFSTYLGVKLLGHMLTLCLTILSNFQVFSKVNVWVYIPIHGIWEFQSPYSQQPLWIFWLLAILVGME